MEQEYYPHIKISPTINEIPAEIMDVFLACSKERYESIKGDDMEARIARNDAWIACAKAENRVIPLHKDDKLPEGEVLWFYVNTTPANQEQHYPTE